MATFREPFAPSSRLFLQHVSEELAFELARRVRAAASQAFVSGGDMTYGARRDVYPHQRHALLQHAIVELGKTHGHGVTATEAPNSRKNRTYAELVVGPVVIVPAAVDHEGALPREATYRRSLAENPMRALPGFEMPDGDGAPGDALFALLLHGPSSDYPRGLSQATPGFVVVRFPNAGCTAYVEGRIDLLSRLAARERGTEYQHGPRLRPQREVA